jgi:hypothetical protein
MGLGYSPNKMFGEIQGSDAIEPLIVSNFLELHKERLQTIFSIDFMKVVRKNMPKKFTL